MELASTLAKNAAKPNSFKIIPLQTKRKENIWKTEETLAGAIVTRETERIKESSP
jgi:spore coat polysaccharide biosynthesis predicted glycosyltransferase SpsG